LTDGRATRHVAKVQTALGELCLIEEAGCLLDD
jgi:hypothetical protein